jgi:hypothetical protein
LQECGQFFQVYRHFILIAESGIEVQLLVYDYPCERFRRSLLPALREQYLDGIGRHHGGGNHEKYQQQEYEVCHRRHTEVG